MSCLVSICVFLPFPLFLLVIFRFNSSQEIGYKDIINLSINFLNGSNNIRLHAGESKRENLFYTIKSHFFKPTFFFPRINENRKNKALKNGIKQKGFIKHYLLSINELWL